MRELSLVISLVFITALSGCSSGKPNDENIKSAIKNIMPSNYQLLSVNRLKEVPGLLEVVVTMDSRPVVLYMDEKAQYVFSGSLLHVETKKNLTIESQERFKSK